MLYDVPSDIVKELISEKQREMFMYVKKYKCTPNCIFVLIELVEGFYTFK